MAPSSAGSSFENEVGRGGGGGGLWPHLFSMLLTSVVFRLIVVVAGIISWFPAILFNEVHRNSFYNGPPASKNGDVGCSLTQPIVPPANVDPMKDRTMTLGVQVSIGTVDLASIRGAPLVVPHCQATSKAHAATTTLRAM